MEYRPDLYNAKNIIGYTGDRHCYPTVYFHNRYTGEFGRITQKYSDPKNIGRSPDNRAKDYSIFNDRDGKAVEFYDREPQHFSRSRFATVKSHTLRMVLAISIVRHKDIKPMYQTIKPRTQEFKQLR